VTVEIKHKFQSPKVDALDTTEVRPSNWNDNHDISMASDTVLGRASAGDGAAEEIPFKALARSLADADSIAEFAAVLGIPIPRTGDVQISLRNDALPGWVPMNDGTIGSASSGATTRANADCQPLYTWIWENIDNAYAPVTGGKGVSAAADWAANKPLKLLKTLGHVLGFAGAGAGLTSRALGQTAGAEKQNLTEAQLPQLTLTGVQTKDSVVKTATISLNQQEVAAGPNTNRVTNVTLNKTEGKVGMEGTLGGSSADLSIVQPTVFMRAYIKL